MSFASFPLEKLGLAPAQLAACQKGGFEIALDEVMFRRFTLVASLRCVVAWENSSSSLDT